MFAIRPLARLSRLTPLALLACAGDPTDDDDTGSDTDPAADEGLGLTLPVTGDYGCFTPQTSFDATTWLTQTGVQAPGTVDVDGVVQDFESDEPRARRDVTLWFADDVSTASDATGSVGTDTSGVITFSGVPSCDPIAYLVEEEAGLNEAKPTYKAHQIYGPGTGGRIDGEYISVSNDTYNLIPTIFGVDLDPARGVIAGTAFDCTRDPDTLSDVDAGKVENAKVRVTDLDGTVLDGVEGRYFVDGFPTKAQPHTSADGLWGVFNLPEGVWRVEMWGLIDGEEVVLGATTAEVYADSINIANIFAGYADGVKYPEACLGDGGGDTDASGDTNDTDA